MKKIFVLALLFFSFNYYNNICAEVLNIRNKDEVLNIRNKDDLNKITKINEKITKIWLRENNKTLFGDFIKKINLFPNLTEFGCNENLNVDFPSKLGKLTRLFIDYNTFNIESIPENRNLKVFSISGKDGEEKNVDLSWIAVKFPNLIELLVSHFPELTNLNLGNLESLIELRLIALPEVSKLPKLSNLKSLRKLVLAWLPKVSKDVLEGLTLESGTIFDLKDYDGSFKDLNDETMNSLGIIPAKSRKFIKLIKDEIKDEIESIKDEINAKINKRVNEISERINEISERSKKNEKNARINEITGKEINKKVEVMDEKMRAASNPYERKMRAYDRTGS